MRGGERRRGEAGRGAPSLPASWFKINDFPWRARPQTASTPTGPRISRRHARASSPSSNFCVASSNMSRWSGRAAAEDEAEEGAPWAAAAGARAGAAAGFGRALNISSSRSCLASGKQVSCGRSL